MQVCFSFQEACVVNGNAKWPSYLGKQLTVPLTKSYHTTQLSHCSHLPKRQENSLQKLAVNIYTTFNNIHPKLKCPSVGEEIEMGWRISINAILLSNKETWTISTYDKMDISQKKSV